MTKIGILALQGAFAEHERVLKHLGLKRFKSEIDRIGKPTLIWTGSFYQGESRQSWGNSCMI